MRRENESWDSLHLCRQRGCSSLLEPDLQLLRRLGYGHDLEVEGRVPLELRRLETVCAERGLHPGVLKIDTQGTELDILKGYDALLREILVVELEVEFTPMYQGQLLFAVVDAWMRAQGFTLRGLKRSCWRRSTPARAGRKLARRPVDARGRLVCQRDHRFPSRKSEHQGCRASAGSACGILPG